MNDIRQLHNVGSGSRATTGRLKTPLSWVLRISGIVILVIGLQSWGFSRHSTPLIDEAQRQLMLLQAEVPGRRLIDATMVGLRDYWQASSDALRKRQIVELRDTFVQGFRDNPRLVIVDAMRIVNGFDTNSETEKELLATLRQQLLRLQEVYTDHYAGVISAYSDAPLYLQPTAALHSRNRAGKNALDFNHALYLMLVGERSAANTIYTDLRHNTNSDELESRVLFAQARLQYDAFEIEKNPEYYLQAVQYARQSAQSDATYDLPKLFLEYLLSIDLEAMEVESTPEEGQGSGESQGERGAISTGSREH